MTIEYLEPNDTSSSSNSVPFPFRHHLERRGTFGDFLKSVFHADTQPPPTIIREGRNLNQPKNGPPIIFNQPIDSGKRGERHPELSAIQ